MRAAIALSSFSLILGVFCYVFGFPLVFSDDEHLAWRQRMMKDENVTRLVGMAFVVIAAVTLKRQWQISSDGEGIIVTIVWLTLFKSLFMAWWPAPFIVYRERAEAAFFDTPAMRMFVGFILVLLGALFTYIGILLPA